MTHEEIIVIIIGLLGVAFQSLLKLNSLMTDARVANMPFDPVKDYLLKDTVGIVLSLLSVLVWYFLFKEIAAKYGFLANFIRTSYFVMGAMGSYVIQTALSKAKQKIRDTVDVKTDELDAIKQTPVVPLNNDKPSA